MTELSSLVKKNESLFLKRRNILGDPWKNEVYGYSNVRKEHGFLFINNVHFVSRKAEIRLDSSVGLEAASGVPLEIASHFPEKRRIVREDGSLFRGGDVVEVWMRPFEVLMLEVNSSDDSPQTLLKRDISPQQAPKLGVSLALQPSAEAEWMQMRFADAARFEQQGFRHKSRAWTTTLPNVEEGPHILAVTVRLQKDGIEWRYSPAVVEIAQVLCRVGDAKVTLIPVPDARQYGNTQKMGSSWAVYKVRLNPAWSGLPVQFAFHAHLPENVETLVEAWVVRRWWEENTRPLGDGYYGDAPS